MEVSSIKDFILSHREDDVRELALKASKYPEIDLPWALNQISGWQKSKSKLPLWAQNEDIVYPNSLSVEQSSSENTARYKVKIALKLLKETQSRKTAISSNSSTLVDLTGGLGVDFSFLAECFSHSIYVERNESLCKIAKHNFEVLALKSFKIINSRAEEFLSSFNKATLIYVDPSRRDKNGNRTYLISSCSPNLIELMPQLIEKSEYVMVKLSPMLDYHKAISDFGPYVGQVHIVSFFGECKELLLILSRHYNGLEKVYCSSDETMFSYSPKGLTAKETGDESINSSIAFKDSYLYEPNSSIMKAGCFDLLSFRFKVRQISKNSHLFLSEDFLKEFPGRRFKVIDIISMNQRDIKSKLSDLSSANIAVRNFPLTAKQLKNRLKLKDGGDTYIFATTLKDSSHVLFRCEKEA